MILNGDIALVEGRIDTTGIADLNLQLAMVKLRSKGLMSMACSDYSWFLRSRSQLPWVLLPMFRPTIGESRKSMAGGSFIGARQQQVFSMERYHYTIYYQIRDGDLLFRF
ncbi:MAG TPA: hypothetical protein DCF63_04070 [Planctomycetaceae bacterium]|nr:hypothetical protein [Planctomycetaceae bacterium]